MKSNKHTDFIKSIKLKADKPKKNGNEQVKRSGKLHEMSGYEETDLQKELERRFYELFGITDDD